MTPPTRAELLAARLLDVPGHHIMPRCPGPNCPISYWPCKLLARSVGNISVAEVLPRLRCKTCGERPVKVEITDDMTHAPPHGLKPYTWVVQLAP